MAHRTTRMLEASIQEVIRYGHENRNAETLIEDNILPFFTPRASIQSASCTKNGVYYGDPVEARPYFESLYRKAQRTPTLKVFFSDIEVVTIDRDLYKCKVHFVQEWQSKNYTDETIKEVFIHFEENGGVFTAKIGNIRVVDIQCGKR